MRSATEQRSSRLDRLARLTVVTVLVGVTSGLGGMMLSLLLRQVQNWAYGEGMQQWGIPIGFLDGVIMVSPGRRIMVLMVCGVIAGLGWWGMRRYLGPPVSVDEALATKRPSPLGLTSIVHVLLQIITVAMGSPLGREAAPRELAALFAQRLGNMAGLSTRDMKLMMACGAGAGLAAVYNVPFAGAMYTLEALLGTLHWSALIPAMATSSVAVVVSWIALPNGPQYQIDFMVSNYSLVGWAVLAGPILGLAAYAFMQSTASAYRYPVSNAWRPLFCLLNFTLIGVLAIPFPSLLGNGESPVQLVFDRNIGIALSATLLGLRWVFTYTSLRAGAYGGLLTPSMATGALLGVLLGGCWQLLDPSVSPTACALIGAAAFLAAAERMPITAVMLIFEMTRIQANFMIPILLAVTGAVAVYEACLDRSAR